MKPYVKLSIGFFEDEKFDGLGGQAIGLWCCLLALAAELRRDGSIPRQKMRRLHQFRNLRRSLRDLETAGLITSNSTEITINNYTKYQTTKSKIEGKSGHEADTKRTQGGRRVDVGWTQGGHETNMTEHKTSIESRNLKKAKSKKLEVRSNNIKSTPLTPQGGSAKNGEGPIEGGIQLTKETASFGWHLGYISPTNLKKASKLFPITRDEFNFAHAKTDDGGKKQNPVSYFLGVIVGDRKNPTTKASTAGGGHVGYHPGSTEFGEGDQTL